jgi:hypothetical protein
MTNVNWERWARATGIGFVVLFIAGYITLGSQPGLSDSVQQIGSYYDGDRSRILTGGVILGIAILFFVWFVGAIANALREAGEGRLAATTVAAGSAFTALFFVIGLLTMGLAHSIAGNGDTGVIQALFDLVWATNVIISFPGAAFIAAASIGLWRAGLVPTWFGQVGIVGSIIVLLGGTTWATDGIWAPDGAYTYVTMVIALAWITVASGILTMATATERAPAAASARPT